MKTLRARYEALHDECLVSIATELERYVSEIMANTKHLDRVSARAKTITSFLKKAAHKQDGRKKYFDPMAQIQDMIGVRVVVFYKSDIPKVDEIAQNHFRSIEAKDRFPESNWEFGYFGRHHIFIIPSHLKFGNIANRDYPSFFEMQIKTLFQHAWSEAGHDLAYKPGQQILTNEQNRQLAYTSAQAWGADEMFNALYLSSLKEKA